MATYIALLRGINLSGKKKIKMQELVALYESLGFKDVRTYLQSGNVIFEAMPTPIKELSSTIEQRIIQVFKFEVSVLMRTPDELKQIAEGNPFLKEKDIDVNRLHVTFLSEAPGKPVLSALREIHDESDRFIISNKEAYLYCPNGYGRTKFSNELFERKLGVTATTRNWKTVNALLQNANNHAGKT